MSPGNLYSQIPLNLPDEVLHTLLTAEGVRIERILSHGHASPAGFWYDQTEGEWLLLVQGAARLRFEDHEIEMKSGDYLNIVAHQKHRLEWTTPHEPTIWLAVFYQSEAR